MNDGFRVFKVLLSGSETLVCLTINKVNESVKIYFFIEKYSTVLNSMYSDVDLTFYDSLFLVKVLLSILKKI